MAVRLIVDREREIQQFASTPTLHTLGNFITPSGRFSAKGQNFANIDDARSFLEKASISTYTVQSVQSKPAKKTPSAPFTTSTLQQEASRKL